MRFESLVFFCVSQNFPANNPSIWMLASPWTMESSPTARSGQWEIALKIEQIREKHIKIQYNFHRVRRSEHMEARAENDTRESETKHRDGGKWRNINFLSDAANEHLKLFFVLSRRHFRRNFAAGCREFSISRRMTLWHGSPVCRR